MWPHSTLRFEPQLFHNLGAVRLAQRSGPQRSHLLQALYNTIACSSDDRNTCKNRMEQCRSPLTGRGCIRRGGAASFSFSPSLPASSLALGPRCPITCTCSGSSRSATGTWSGKPCLLCGGCSVLLSLHTMF